MHYTKWNKTIKKITASIHLCFPLLLSCFYTCATCAGRTQFQTFVSVSSALGFIPVVRVVRGRPRSPAHRFCKILYTWFGMPSLSSIDQQYFFILCIHPSHHTFSSPPFWGTPNKWRDVMPLEAVCRAFSWESSSLRSIWVRWTVCICNLITQDERRGACH